MIKIIKVGYTRIFEKAALTNINGDYHELQLDLLAAFLFPSVENHTGLNVPATKTLREMVRKSRERKLFCPP